MNCFLSLETKVKTVYSWRAIFLYFVKGKIFRGRISVCNNSPDYEFDDSKCILINIIVWSHFVWHYPYVCHNLRNIVKLRENTNKGARLLGTRRPQHSDHLNLLVLRHVFHFRSCQVTAMVNRTGRGGGGAVYVMMSLRPHPLPYSYDWCNVWCNKDTCIIWTTVKTT